MGTMNVSLTKVLLEYVETEVASEIVPAALRASERSGGGGWGGLSCFALRASQDKPPHASAPHPSDPSQQANRLEFAG